MPTGTLKFFDADKGFGSIRPDDGSRDVFVHGSAVERAGLKKLSENQKLSYQVRNELNGKVSAINLKAL